MASSVKGALILNSLKMSSSIDEELREKINAMLRGEADQLQDHIHQQNVGEAHPTFVLSSEDEEILDMCPLEENSSVEFNDHRISKPLNMDMTSSVFNINNSRDVQIGQRIVAADDISPAGICSPFFNREVDISNCGECEHDIEPGNFSSIQLKNGRNPGLRININPPLDGQSFSSSNDNSRIRKSYSVPNGTTVKNDDVMYHRKLSDISIRDTPMTPVSPANIIDSSNIQMGTQIVINSVRCSHGSSGELSSTEFKSPSSQVFQYVRECRENLTKEYLSRTQSTSFLPWHRGYQVIPIDDYYTDIRILTVDNWGNPTKQAVHILEVLEEDFKSPLLIEGEAGMGKTLLMTKIAQDWAFGSCLQKFQLVLLVSLRDFKGNFKQYIFEELLSSDFEEKFKEVWEYAKMDKIKILFILDGYDELEDSSRGEIQKLLKRRDFPNSKVVLTSRPDIVQCTGKRLMVKGFNDEQMLKFIEKYFCLKKDCASGRSLAKIFEGDSKYRKLAKRPLICVLICMLYEREQARSSLPEKISEVMFKITLCLIKWNKVKEENANEDLLAFPVDYEELFLQFGKVCVFALKMDKWRFSEQDLEQVKDLQKLKELGFLYSDNESAVLGRRKFLKPVHQTFLEYFAALYISKHVNVCKFCKVCKEFSDILQRKPEILRFVVGILDDKAFKILNKRQNSGLPKFRESELLQLLKEAGPSYENCKAIANLLDKPSAEVTTSSFDFEWWSHLLSQHFQKLHTLEIVWRIKSRNPDQESFFEEASPELYSKFFRALHSNSSIRNLYIRLKQDGEQFTEANFDSFFKFLCYGIGKKNLRHLEIKEMKVNVSKHLRNAIEQAALLNSMNQAQICLFQTLEVFKVDAFIDDRDLEVICDLLRREAPNLQTLGLNGLEHGHAGFTSLAKLIRESKSIRSLHISMNKEKLLTLESKNFCSPSEMNTKAIRSSCEAFEVNCTIRSTSPPKDLNKKKSKEELFDSCVSEEMKYIFASLQDDNLPVLDSRGYWAIKGKDGTMVPLPFCDANNHKSVFHCLFSAFPQSNLKNLTLAEPFIYLSLSDLVCLGNALRRHSLSSLNLEIMSDINNYMPILLALGPTSSLISLNMRSDRVNVADFHLELVCGVLRNNKSLRNLSIQNWHFVLQDKISAINRVSNTVSSWQVEEINLKHCTVDISTNDKSPNVRSRRTPSQVLEMPIMPPVIAPIGSPPLEWKSAKKIVLAEVEVTEPNLLVRRGNHIISNFRKCENLTYLDLSAAQPRTIVVNDDSIKSFFRLMATNLKSVKELALDEWQFHFEQYENTCIEVGKLVQSCKNLKTIRLNKVNELGCITGSCHHTLLHHLVTNCQSLMKIHLAFYKINDEYWNKDTTHRLASCFSAHWNTAKFQMEFASIIPDAEATIREIFDRPPCKLSRSHKDILPYIFKVKKSPLLKFMNNLSSI